MYIAKAHIGGKYAPGEIIRDEIPSPTRDWLLATGAIQACALEPDKAALDRHHILNERMAEKPEPENGETVPDDDLVPSDETAADDAVETTAAPEIDAMDGVTPAQEESDTPNQVKKTSGRRKAK